MKAEPLPAAPAPAPRKPTAPASAPAPAPPAVDLPLAPPKGPILLPHGGSRDLLDHFRGRQQALLEQSPKKAALESKALVELRDSLDFPDLFTASTALCREASRELASGLGPQALATATLAAALAPDLPLAAWTMARAELAAGGAGSLGRAARDVWLAGLAALEEPHYLHAMVSDIAVSGLMAAVVAGGLALLILLCLRLRYALHDFHHLFPKAASSVQTTILGLILLGIPWLFHLGPFIALSSLTLAIWLYLDGAERAVAGLLLAWIVAAPFLVGEIARWGALSPLGEDLVSVERDLDSDPAAARLSAAANDEHPPYSVLFALGHRQKRVGELEEAEKSFRRALALYPGRAAAENNLGNVLFLEGNLQGARTQYEAAIDHDPSLASAYFNLGQAFNRLLLLDQSQQAQRHALELDRGLIEPHVSGDDLRANRYLIDVPLTWGEIAETGRGSLASGVRSQAMARLFGPLSRSALPAAGVVMALLFILAILGPRMRPSSQCVKCGRPVCGRCDADLAGDGLCGQCVNVFIRRSVADPPARIRKEARVKAYQSWRGMLVRALAVLLGGGGHVAGGQPLVGYVLLWSLAFLGLNAFGGASFFRTPVAGLWVVRLLLFGLLLLPVYGLAVRSVFMDER
ncbi:MAG: tetratricopeptide repeat protein [Deltaproteobacteria bacterium]